MYNYNELMEDISLGREVEFYHNQKKYSISQNTNGWYLTEYGNTQYQSFKTSDDLLSRAIIEGNKLNII